MIQRIIRLFVWTLLVAVLSVLATNLIGHYRRLFADGVQGGLIGTVYNCCQAYEEAHHRPPQNGEELAKYAEDGSYKVVAEAIRQERVLYLPVASDTWAIVLLRPTANLKVVERIKAGDKYHIRWYYDKGNRVLRREFDENER